MTDYVHRHSFRNLEKARRLAEGFRVDIERLVDGGRALRRKLLCAVREMAQIVHLLLAEEKIQIRPTIDSGRCPYLNEAASGLQNVEAIAMFYGGDHGSSRTEVLAEVQ